MADKYDGLSEQQLRAEIRRLAKREETQKDQIKQYTRYDPFKDLSDEDVSILSNMVGADVPDGEKARQLYGIAQRLDPSVDVRETIEAQLDNIEGETMTNVNPEGNLQQASADPRPNVPDPNVQSGQPVFTQPQTTQDGRVAVPRGSVPDPTTAEGMRWYQDFAQAVQQRELQQQQEQMRAQIRAEVEADMRRDSMAAELKPFGFTPENETDIPALNLGLALMHNGYSAEDTAAVLRQRFPDPNSAASTAPAAEPAAADPPPPVPTAAGAGTLSGTIPGTPTSSGNPTETGKPIGGGVYKQSDGGFKDASGGDVPSIADSATYDTWLNAQIARETQMQTQVGAE